jgi:hypothetical protein
MSRNSVQSLWSATILELVVAELGKWNNKGELFCPSSIFLFFYNVPFPQSAFL